MLCPCFVLGAVPLKAYADARVELEVVARLGRVDEGSCAERWAGEHDCLAAVMDDGVAGVEARDDAARWVELKHAAHVEGGVRRALAVEEREAARVAAVRDEPPFAETDQAGARF